MVSVIACADPRRRKEFPVQRVRLETSTTRVPLIPTTTEPV